MSEGGYKIRNQSAIHFITFVPIAIGIEWVDLPTGRQAYLQEKNTAILFWKVLNIVKPKRVCYCIVGVL